MCGTHVYSSLILQENASQCTLKYDFILAYRDHHRIQEAFGNKRKLPQDILGRPSQQGSINKLS